MCTASGSPYGVEATQSAINQGAHALSVSYRRDAAYLKPSVFEHFRGSGDAQPSFAHPQRGPQSPDVGSLVSSHQDQQRPCICQKDKGFDNAALGGVYSAGRSFSGASIGWQFAN
jgi:hypothetical protein